MKAMDKIQLNLKKQIFITNLFSTNLLSYLVRVISIP
jgi:hypothetical protein